MALALLPALIRPESALAQAGAFVVNCEARTPILALPHTISRPGSYYLRHNLHAVGAGNGITVTASDVTLDLNGFALVGSPGSGNGIDANLSGLSGLVVRNGSVSSWGGAGIEASSATHCRFDSLILHDCGAQGVYGGSASLVRDCCARANGIAAGADGLRVAADSRITDCIATGNGNDGIRVGDGSCISGSVANSNAQDGFRLARAVTIVDSQARGNGAVGIHSPGTPCTIARCTAESNGSHGLEIGDGSNVSNCVSDDNVGYGILMNDRSIVEHCSVTRNALAGIRTQWDSRVVGNVCCSNATGIETILAGSFIDGNVCSQNTQYGILDNGTGSTYFTRNVCQLNGTNYLLGASSSWAAIIPMPGPGFLTDQPWANFE